MSTDWHVHCLDCKDTHEFRDANWCDDDMAVLCKHAAAIAALVPLLGETRLLTVELMTMYGRIEAHWFAQHAGHRLVPINEYGDFIGQCAEYVDCACGSRRRCTLHHGHEGEHKPERRQ